MGAAWNDGPLQATAGPPSAGEGSRAGVPAGDTSRADEPPAISPADPLLQHWLISVEVEAETLMDAVNYVDRQVYLRAAEGRPVRIHLRPVAP